MQPDQQPAQRGHGDGADRVEFDHGAEALGRRRSGTAPDGSAALSRSSATRRCRRRSRRRRTARPARSRRCGPARAASAARAARHRRTRGGDDGSGWTRFSRRAGLSERPRWLSRQEVSTCATSSGASEKKCILGTCAPQDQPLRCRFATGCGKFNRSIQEVARQPSLQRGSPRGRPRRRPAPPRPPVRAWRNPAYGPGSARRPAATDRRWRRSPCPRRGVPAPTRPASPHRAPAADARSWC